MTDNSNPNLPQTQAQPDIKGLITALSSEDKLIRRRATAAIRAMGAITGLPALQRAQVAEDDPETGQMMAEAISALKTLSGHPETTDTDTAVETPQDEVKRQIENLKAENADSVLHAAERLGELGDKSAVEALIFAFNNQKHSIHVRLAIAEALLELESAPVEVALLANIRHSDWHIRRNGAAILGQLKATWAIEPLSEILSDPHPVVRRTALAALKHIGTPESRKALAQYMPDVSPVSKKQESRKEVSGIEVKHPGQQATDNENKSLLNRLDGDRKSAEDSRRETQVIDASGLKKRQKRIEVTEPISNNMLDQLDLVLDDDADETDET